MGGIAKMRYSFYHAVSNRRPSMYLVSNCVLPSVGEDSQLMDARLQQPAVCLLVFLEKFTPQNRYLSTWLTQRCVKNMFLLRDVAPMPKEGTAVQI
jgi:hypothetical protein